MRRTVLCLILFLGLSPACDDDDGTGAPDAGAPDGRGDAAAPDAAAPDAPAGAPDASAPRDGAPGDTAAVPAAVQRGEYLVNNVLGCVGCHTPAGMMGLDRTKLLAGNPCFIDVMPPADNGMGCLHGPNLTNHETGLKNLTDQQIKELVTTGRRPGDGKYLFDAMPYHQYANLRPADADAVVAYLRTVPGVENRLPMNEPPFHVRPDAPQSAALPLARFPNAATGTTSENGRYLAALACAHCHTLDAASAMPRTLDQAKLFQGGREYTVGMGKVWSSNLTPDETGVRGWTAEQIARAIKMGLDKDGNRICAPMRTLPGMTDADARDIGTYLLSLAPARNMIPMQCTAM